MFDTRKLTHSRQPTKFVQLRRRLFVRPSVTTASLHHRASSDAIATPSAAPLLQKSKAAAGLRLSLVNHSIAAAVSVHLRSQQQQTHLPQMAQAFGGNRGLQPIPPEKGVFPLDHLQECKQAMREYMQCLKESKFSSERCRQLSKAYLECRMERNLMVKQDLNELGFKDSSSQPVEEAVTGSPTSPS